VRDRKQSSEVAAEDRMLVVIGGSYFRALLDAAQGHTDRKPDARDAQHAELRRSLGPGAVMATWLLGEHWLERVAGVEGNSRLSPLSALQAVGVRVALDDTPRGRVLLDCADSAGAARLASLLDELRTSARDLPWIRRFFGLIQRVSVTSAGARLQLAIEPTRAELDALLGLLLGP
jgi:hypothetical protein